MEHDKRCEEVINPKDAIQHCKCYERAEINRLREALAKIISDGDYTAPEGMKRIAREALRPNV